MKKIKKLEHYIKYGYDTGFRVSFPYSSVDDNKKEYLNLCEGSYSIPLYNKKYRMTAENIEGILKIRKDLPKISKTIYVTRYSPRFIEYNYDRDVYQRMRSTPLRVKIGLEKDEFGNFYICSPILTKDTSDEEILMYLNLFKDLFGKFIICNPFFKEIIKMDLKKEWEILRPGQRKLDKELIIDHISKTCKISKEELERKYSVFFKKDCSTLATGREGFKGYYAFSYENSSYVIMEKFKENNATYIFPSDKWEEYSKLTKMEVINGRLYIKRIRHNKNWNERIAKYLP